ncbi:MAG: methionine ABC transporter permease [Candidatus Wallacebacter cryptica]|jgi:D-methionine transport system permease protein|nr:ABC transporter permease [Bacillota bacterium]
MDKSIILRVLWQAAGETLYMVGVSVVAAQILGLPLGVLLVITDDGHILENKVINRILSTIINIGRSIPFIILLVAIIPLTKFLLGTYIGTTATIVPLTVAAIPFVARVVESTLKEVDPGVVEAAQAMGASPWQIVYKVLLPESLPGLVLGFTLTAVNLIGYSAMAGTVGGGGLGDIAIRFGYQRYRVDIILYTVIILVVLVQVLQALGNLLARRLARR